MRGAAIIAVVSLVGLVCVSVSRTSAKYDWVGKVLGRGGGVCLGTHVAKALSCICVFGGGEERKDGWTLARHEERLPASWRARSRRRSYSASVELD